MEWVMELNICEFILGMILCYKKTTTPKWDGVLVKVKLEKWKWCMPKMSFRRSVIVINNLVASILWHNLICVDPPSGLFLEWVSLDSPMHTFSSQGGRRTKTYTSGQQKSGFSTVVYTELFNRTVVFGLEESSWHYF